MTPKARRNLGFDYQSVCHCSKTGAVGDAVDMGLTTSQFVTAPKPRRLRGHGRRGLTTSQFVTAPKPVRRVIERLGGLTTSQFVTAPKRLPR